MEISKKRNLDNKNEVNDLKMVKIDLINGKDEIRWIFVEICLEFLKLFKEFLVSLLVSEKNSD